MSYTYPISSDAMFEDRFDQFVTLGLPGSDVQNMRDSINDMWADGPGGWVYEWSRLATGYAGNGQEYLASLACGCAKNVSALLTMRDV
jgi:esterase FrsA